MRLIKRQNASSPAATNGFSLVDSAAAITGDLETSGSLRIDGRMDGTVRRADVVVLGVGATMAGDIHAREVVIGGTLTGTVHASERVELQATGIVTGDLVTQSVLVQEGGVVNGRVLMQPPQVAGTPVGADAATAGMASPARR
jgi:cytoskeletal protein CcmA (bactofilin family)